MIGFSVKATARLHARRALQEAGHAELWDIRSSRSALREQLRSSSLILISSITAGAILLLWILTAASARERRVEVAILRALGLESRGVLTLFMLKAVLTGLAGGLFGGVLGLLVSRAVAGEYATLSPLLLAAILATTLGVSMLASALPAWMAATREPAEVLRRG